LQQPPLALGPVALVAFGSLALALRMMPRVIATTPPAAPARWDLPARMLSATVVVLAITESAPVIGPRWSGMLATFPVYAAILTVFAHRAAAAPAVQVLRGLLWGLFGFAGFFLILGALIEHTGIALAFVAASGTALGLQALSLTRARAAVDARPGP
jgi:hypothetical protein